MERVKRKLFAKNVNQKKQQGNFIDNPNSRSVSLKIDTASSRCKESIDCSLTAVRQQWVCAHLCMGVCVCASKPSNCHATGSSGCRGACLVAPIPMWGRCSNTDRWLVSCLLLLFSSPLGLGPSLRLRLGFGPDLNAHLA